MGCHPSGVTTTRIRVIGINFGEILIKGKEIQFELAEVRVSGSSSYRVSTVVLSTVTGSLSDDDGDGNKNGKKAIGLDQ